MIISNNDREIIPFFKESEFYGKTADESHFLDGTLVQAAGLIRQVYGVPVHVNSTFRSEAFNATIGGAKNSQHLKGKAIDLRFDKVAELISDIENKGTTYAYLRSMGISGFGFYDSFIHLDTRGPGDTMTESDQYGLLETWDSRKKKGLDNFIPSRDMEDGFKGQAKQFIFSLTAIFAIIYLFFFIIYKTKK